MALFKTVRRGAKPDGLGHHENSVKMRIDKGYFIGFGESSSSKKTRNILG
jgi:hypothetical protein